MPRPLALPILPLVTVLFGFSLVGTGCSANLASDIPGPQVKGKTLLPNGWYLSPAGKGVSVGELPLNILLSPDERFALSIDNGKAGQSVSVVETSTWRVIQTLPVRAAWLGAKFVDGGRRFLLSGGNDNLIREYSFNRGEAALTGSIVVGAPWPKDSLWLAGLDVDERSGRIFVAGMHCNTLFVLGRESRSVIRRIPLRGRPYTCVVLPDRGLVAVSLWDGAAVVFVDQESLGVVQNIQVGSHPNDMVESPDGKRLFVANANVNTVSVIDLDRMKVTETLSTALRTNDPEGSTPNSVAVSPDGTRLYVANADNNCLAVMDIGTPGETRPLGFIPTGWYPTCVRCIRSTGGLIVANGKGFGSAANPEGPDPWDDASPDQYTGSMFKGSLSLIDPPTAARLSSFTASVLSNVPAGPSVATVWGASNPIPRDSSVQSPIKHVFYVIKENRTYDQVFGDIKEGNGDPALCLFPETVTPNLHALAKEFVLLDNLYADAEVSADGHNWSMGAYATDYVEKTWPTQYGGRGGTYEYEGGTEAVYPASGYLWDNCLRHNVTYRTYGEFVFNGETLSDTSTATMASLQGHVAPHYRGWDLDYSDVLRVQAWMNEFDVYDREGGLPRFQIVKLPNDHTAGTSHGSLTPVALVAQNDLAVGLLVERISRSRYWKESAIFIIEDDAQNGPDHVDAHRTEALVISPYTKRHFVDHQMYSTCSMVRTMELILGLPPLSQFDAAATPLFNSFTDKPDLAPFSHIEPEVDLHERNRSGAIGQRESDGMDFSGEDRTSMLELNEILWKSIRGENAEMPAPVRSALLAPIGTRD